MKAGRIHVGEGAPAVYAGLHRMSERSEKAALEAGIDRKAIELIKMRASQINGCAYCLDLHTRDALEIGETTGRLAVLSAWRETTRFTPEEEAMLELTEVVTRISEGPLSEADQERIVGVLGEERFAAAFWVATVINSYNRVAITSHYPVEPEG